MDRTKERPNKAVQGKNASEENASKGKKPFYKEAWFYVAAAVVLATAMTGAGIAIGSNLAKNDATDSGAADSNIDVEDDLAQKDQELNSKKEDDDDGAPETNSSSTDGGSTLTNPGSSSSSNAGSSATNSDHDLTNDGIGVYGLNQTVSFLGYEVKVTKVERNYKPRSSVKPLLSSNDEFVRVTVEIKNVSNKDGNYSALDWSIDASDGSPTGNIDACTDNSCLSADDLPIGKKVSGTMVYEVPKKASWIALHYRPIFTYEGEVVFELPAK